MTPLPVMALLSVAMFGCLAAPPLAEGYFGLVRTAEYCGRNIDGEMFSASAFSYDTANYYYVDVEFDGDEVVLIFSHGGKLRLALDTEEIDDPSGISAFDYDHGVYWDLDVDGLECDG